MSYSKCVKTKNSEGGDGIDVLEDILYEILLELKKINLQLAIMTDNELTNEEVE
jgi:hypothetical protein